MTITKLQQAPLAIHTATAEMFARAELLSTATTTMMLIATRAKMDGAAPVISCSILKPQTIERKFVIVCSK